MFGNRLKLWREQGGNQLLIDVNPTGREEEENVFGQQPVNDPRDLNDVVLRERMQNMSERILYADRAFYVTMIWVRFLVALTVFQMLLSIWSHGLSDAQFVTVVTTTTASVFGFWLLVGRYLHAREGMPDGVAPRPAEDVTAEPVQDEHIA